MDKALTKKTKRALELEINGGKALELWAVFNHRDRRMRCRITWKELNLAIAAMGDDFKEDDFCYRIE